MMGHKPTPTPAWPAASAMAAIRRVAACVSTAAAFAPAHGIEDRGRW